MGSEFVSGHYTLEAQDRAASVPRACKGDGHTILTNPKPKISAVHLVRITRGRHHALVKVQTAIINCKATKADGVPLLAMDLSCGDSWDSANSANLQDCHVGV